MISSYKATPPWLSYRGVDPVGKERAYVQIPAFNYATPTWLGASQIIAQINYSASNNFILRELPAAPSGCNYCLCIRYRVGNTVYRYKLWSDVGETLYVSLYNGELIKKNFVIEIWSTNSGSNAIGTALTIDTTVVIVPPNVSNIANYSLATGSATQDIWSPISYSLPLTPLPVMRFRADMGVTLVNPGVDNRVASWIDQGSSPTAISTNLGPGIGSVLTNVGAGNRNAVRLLSSEWFLNADPTLYMPAHFFMVVRQYLFNSGDIIYTAGRSLKQNGVSCNVRLGLDNGGTLDNAGAVEGSNYFVLEVKYYLTAGPTRTNWIFNIYNLAGVLQATSSTSAAGGSFLQGALQIGGSSIAIAEILGFSSILSAADVTQVLNYINTYYNNIGTLPLVFGSNNDSCWLTN